MIIEELHEGLDGEAGREAELAEAWKRYTADRPMIWAANMIREALNIGRAS